MKLPNMPAIKKIGVVGAGAWGTALAKHLAEKGLTIRLWAYEHDVVTAINATHENSVFLKGITLPRSLAATASLADAIEGCDGILFVVPSHVTRSVLQKLADCLPHPIPVISAVFAIRNSIMRR